MIKKKYDLADFITLFFLIVALAMSFVPVNPWTTGCPPNSEGCKVRYRFFSFFENSVELIHSVHPGFFALMIMFYVGTILSIVFLILDKRLLLKIALTISACVMAFFMLPTSFSVYFGIGITTIYFALFVLNFFWDKKKEKQKE